MTVSFHVHGYGSSYIDDTRPVARAVASERTLQRDNDFVRATRLADGKFRFAHGSTAFVGSIDTYMSFVNKGYVRVA